MNPSIAHRLTDGKKERLNFNFKSLPKPIDIPIATENLLIVKSVFRDKGIPFWLMYGTLLGAIRDGAFIPGDTDTDLGVYETDMEKVLEAFSDMKVAGFEVIRTALKDGLVTLLRRKMYIDFYVMTKVGSFWRYGDGPLTTHDHFSDLIRIPFLGTEFLAPGNPVTFLKAKYGDWKSPGGKHAAY